MGYKEVNIVKGALISKGIIEVYDVKPPTRSKKIYARKNIEENVFDIHDSVADNAKMISLLLTLISRIYPLIDTTNMAIEDKTMANAILLKFSNTQTRADVQFAKEGISMVDKLLDRQAQVGEIVK